MGMTGTGLMLAGWGFAAVLAMVCLVVHRHAGTRMRRAKNKAIAAQQELQASEARYRLLAENATDVIWTLNVPDLTFSYISPSIQRLRGISVDQAMAETFPDSVVPEQREWVKRLIENRLIRFRRGAFEQSEAQRVEVRQRDADGRIITVEIIATLIVDDHDEVVGIQGISRNVTLRAQAEKERRAREAILSALAHGARVLFNNPDKDDAMGKALAGLGEAVAADRVYVFENHVDPDSGHLLASQRYEWVGEGIEPQLDNPEMQNMAYERSIPNWLGTLTSGEAVHGLVEDMPAEERALLEPQGILSIAVVPIFLDGQFWGQIGFDDCTRRHPWSRAEIDALEIAAATIGSAIHGIRAEEELKRLIRTDSLTGLCSRRMFLKQTRQAHERAQVEGWCMGLLIMDLDHFKSINDNHGHPVGDQALKSFARTARESLRGDDLVGRMGGEEFAVLLRDVDLESALDVAEKLRHQVESTPVTTSDGSVSLTVSIGLAISDATEPMFADLLKRADQALYQAKNNGRNQVVASSPPFSRSLRRPSSH
jgi:diguanylate cyclase (GGDEF)-like protein/PAS domain S-box-containing protein